ncbi:adenylate cyclase [Acrasis kona]|uniref:Adenylate cyclase n=1 Tax=Acrasis kona TaxID=1008807 RepID=A0AAW2ZJC0_9EUKA
MNVHSTTPFASPFDSKTNYVRMYQNALNKYYPNATYSIFQLEGYICSQLVIQAAQQALITLNNNIISAIYQTSLFYIKDLSLGNYVTNCTQGSRAVLFADYSNTLNYFLSYQSLWTYTWSTASCYGDTSSITRPVLFAQSSPISSSQGQVANQYTAGVVSAFNQFNSQGGYRGRNVQLDIMDDLTSPDVMLNNTNYFINNANVIGLLGYFQSASIAASLPLVNSNNMPFIGAYSGVNFLRTPFVSNIINIRMGNSDDFLMTLSYIRSYAITRISLFCPDSPIFDDFMTMLSANNIELESFGTYVLGSTNITSAYQNISRGNPEAILMTANDFVITSMIVLIRSDPLRLFSSPSTMKFFVSPAGSSYNIATQLISYKPKADYTTNVFFTQVVPPFSDNQLFNQYVSAMNAYPSMIYNPVSLEGYIVGRTITENLSSLSRNLRGSLSRSSFLRNLYAAQSLFLDGIQVGDYINSCNSTTTYDRCCNQGIKTIGLSRIPPTATNQTTNILTYLSPTSITLPSSQCFVNADSLGYPLTIGIVGTGVTSSSSSTYRYIIGLKAAFYGKSIGSLGTIFLKTYEDYGSNVQNTNALRLMYEKDRVIAVVGQSNQYDAQLIDSYSMFNYTINYIAPQSGSLSLRSPFRSNVINYRSSITDEVSAMLLYMITRSKKTRFIVLANIITTSTVWEDGLLAAIDLGNRNYNTPPKDTIRFTNSNSVDFISTLTSSVINNNVEVIIILGHHSHCVNIINATRSFNLNYMVSNDVNFLGLISALSNDLLRPIIPNVFSTRSLPYDLKLISSYPTMATYVKSINNTNFLISMDLDPTNPTLYTGAFGFEGFVVGTYILQILRSLADTASVTNGRSLSVNIDTLRALFMKYAFNIIPSTQGDIPVGPISNACQTSASAADCCNQISRGVYVQNTLLVSDNKSPPSYTQFLNQVPDFLYSLTGCGTVINPIPFNAVPLVVAVTCGVILLIIITVLIIFIYWRIRVFLRVYKAPKSGLMAIAFTDVQSSTMLWQQFPSEMRKALKIHNSILRSLIHQYHGYEVKTQGDSFMVCFSNPYHAIGWAIRVQNDLLDCGTWPSELILGSYDCRMEWDKFKNVVFRGLRVRIGIHVGDAEKVVDPTTRRPDYFGTSVNKAARVESIAKGGQVLVSTRTLTYVSDCLYNIETGEKASEEQWLKEYKESLDDSSNDNSSSRAESTKSSSIHHLKSNRSNFQRPVMKDDIILYYRAAGEHSLKGLSGKELLFEITSERLSGRVFEEKLSDPMENIELDYVQPINSDALPVVYNSDSPATPSSSPSVAFLRYGSLKIVPS